MSLLASYLTGLARNLCISGFQCSPIAYDHVQRVGDDVNRCSVIEENWSK